MPLFFRDRESSGSSAAMIQKSSQAPFSGNFTLNNLLEIARDCVYRVLKLFSSVIRTPVLTEKRQSFVSYVKEEMRTNSIQICTFRTALGGTGSLKLQICRATWFCNSGSYWKECDLGGTEVDAIIFLWKKKEMLITKEPWPECLNRSCLFKHRRIFIKLIKIKIKCNCWGWELG